MTTDDDAHGRLLLMRERAAERLERAEAALDALTRDRLSASDDDEHDPEGVPLSAEWSRLAGLVDAAREEQDQVEQAFERLAEGSYGCCVVCGGAIPPERLAVRPFADRCVPCAERTVGLRYPGTVDERGPIGV